MRLILRRRSDRLTFPYVFPGAVGKTYYQLNGQEATEVPREAANFALQQFAARVKRMGAVGS